MERVGIRALQQNASAVVARAAAGEVIEITDRGRPVAQLIPIKRSKLETLIAAGLATPATRRIEDMPPPLRTKKGTPSLTELLMEDRADSR